MERCNRYVGVTNAPSIEALQGNINNPYIGGSCQVGPYPVVVGGDFSIIENTSTDDTFWGGTVYGGYGAGMEGHIGLHTESINIAKINIFEMEENFWDSLANMG